MQILIIEDDFRLTRNLCDLIEKLGHKALCAGSATEAIELVKAVPADAAIIDVFVIQDRQYLPDGGLRFISRLRQDFLGDLQMPRKAPILAISAGADIAGGYSPLRIALQLGASHTLKKPFQMSDVEDFLVEVTQTQGLTQTGS